MKAVLAACVALGAISFTALPQAHADDVRVPGVHVDVGDLAECGVELLVAEVLQNLDLVSDTVAWLAPNDAQGIAADLLMRSRSRS